MPRSVCPDHSKYTAGCQGCRAASSAYRLVRKRAVADGTWVGMLSGPEQLAPVRQHVQALLAVPGASGIQIARRSGVSQHTIYRLRDGRQKDLHPDFADAIMGLRPERVEPRRADGPGARVDSIGAARRLQALAADDWDVRTLSSICGASKSELARWRFRAYRQISLTNHIKVRELYEKIQALADPRGPSRATGTQALYRYGYLPPERWADEDIDDPDAQPLPPPPDDDDWVAVTQQIENALQDPQPGKAADYPRPVKREIARHAVNRLGWSWERVAWLLGCESTSTVTYLVRGRPDRAPVRRERKR